MLHNGTGRGARDETVCKPLRMTQRIDIGECCNSHEHGHCRKGGDGPELVCLWEDLEEDERKRDRSTRGRSQIYVWREKMRMDIPATASTSGATDMRSEILVTRVKTSEFRACQPIRYRTGEPSDKSARERKISKYGSRPEHQDSGRSHHSS